MKITWNSNRKWKKKKPYKNYGILQENLRAFVQNPIWPILIISSDNPNLPHLKITLN